MEGFKIYQDIAKRTDGDIYVGVVGPVRTGKSTFIKKFMEQFVLPNIDNEYKKERAIDELPQSASGKTIMTTEPKFIPNEAVGIKLSDNVKMRIRLVDCVGYLVNNAIGYLEDDMPRMVKTPWSEEEMPFEKAAEIGTKKVIEEHSTIGILVTTDGTITDIEREDYIEAEERVVSELKAINKPFVILLNSENPESDDCIKLSEELEKKYDSKVLRVNCSELKSSDMEKIFSNLLYEFNIQRININFPRWVDGLDDTNEVKSNLYESIKNAFGNVCKLKDIEECKNKLDKVEIINKAITENIELGTGEANIKIELDDDLFYNVLTDITGVNISNEGDLFSTITEFSKVKKQYDKIEYALHEVKEKGYGIVNPGIDDLILEEPEIVKQGSRYGVKLKAKAPSIHMIKVDTETEVSPIVGSEKQSEDLLKYLLSEFENDKQKIWESNIFGKNLHELVNEGLQNKLMRMPEDARYKIQETLQRIVNEGSGGLICIIL